MNQPWHVLAPTSGDERWTQLAEMVASGELLLHGSQTHGLRELTPRAPLDFSLDEYSKRTAIYATEDPTWAIAYAVRSAACRQFLNACFYPLDTSGHQQPRRIFLSYAKNDDDAAAPLDAPASVGTLGHVGTSAPVSALVPVSNGPLRPGVVYAIPRDQFRRMPPHTDPALGLILECQWASTETVPVVTEVPVTPQNLPITPLFHDFDAVAARAQQNPEGFPWLDDPGAKRGV